MTDKVAIEVRKQKVFHDGTSMIVLKPGAEGQSIDPKFVAGLVADGIIADPFLPLGELIEDSGAPAGLDLTDEQRASLPKLDDGANGLRTSEGTGVSTKAVDGIADGNMHAADLSQLDHDGDGAPGGSVSASGDDVPVLRAEYAELLGKSPFNGWDAAELRKRIEAHKNAEAAVTGDDGAPAA